MRAVLDNLAAARLFRRLGCGPRRVGTLFRRRLFPFALAPLAWQPTALFRVVGHCRAPNGLPGEAVEVVRLLGA